MLLPLILDFRLENKMSTICADTDKMEDRVAELIVDGFEGRRKNPLILTGDDMLGVMKARVDDNKTGDIPPAINSQILLIQHCAPKQTNRVCA